MLLLHTSISAITCSCCCCCLLPEALIAAAVLTTQQSFLAMLWQVLMAWLAPLWLLLLVAVTVIDLAR
jgi:hypothetical protein